VSKIAVKTDRLRQRATAPIPQENSRLAQLYLSEHYSNKRPHPPLASNEGSVCAIRTIRQHAISGSESHHRHPRSARYERAGNAAWKRPHGSHILVAMCGRARLSTDYSETRIKLRFDPEYPAPNIPASWNVCPTDPMLVAIRSQDGKRVPQQMRWGLVPWWAKDIKVGFSSINARAETVDTTPAFRDAWKKGQRCLVVTDGFYEWKKPEKQPYAVAMADKSQMVMAGLWDEWTEKKTGERIKSCTIITCPPNALIGTLHDRMPVILAEEDWPKWLGEVPVTNDELKALLVPFKDDLLTMWPVNRQKVGNVRNKDREVAEPEALEALSDS
jgi:putative SOS response-associated peptidase YedK